MAEPRHQPVLVQQVVELARPCARGLFVDATVGLGGHAEALLGAYPELTLLGLDVDPQALALASRRLQPFGVRVELVRAPYAELAALVSQRGVSPSGVLFDLGVSSLQLDVAERGFSFRLEGPLDMRFSLEGPTLSEILAAASERQLASWLATYGEERKAAAIAHAILRAQREGRLRTTLDLKRAVWSVTGPKRGRLDPATRTFQALRIVTNRELSSLSQALEGAVRSLGPSGRLFVIAYHSLEDRIVKTTLRRLSGHCVCPPGAETCTCHPQELVELVTKKPIVPDTSEVRKNPRARSAKLRVAERKP